MFILLLLCVVCVLLCWLVKRCIISLCSFAYLSDKAVLITGCDINETAIEVAVLLDKNGVPVFACFCDKENANRLK